MRSNKNAPTEPSLPISGIPGIPKSLGKYTDVRDLQQDGVTHSGGV